MPALRTRRAALAILAVTLLAGTAACGRSVKQAESTAGNINPTANLVTTTPAGTKPVASVTWAVYRDVNSLDPAFSSILGALCGLGSTRWPAS